MVKIFINNRPLEVKEGITVLKAAESAGIYIPHLCYHPAFAAEGSCRMCLVEIEGLPKLELSCSTVVREGMKVFTQTEKVIEARKTVLEFFLAEHPLDCPICDKAGECRLQDYYQEYGLFESRFIEFKEKREKKVTIAKNLILDRERCILCTRCVRFLREITKTQELGVLNRGLRSEIGVFEEDLIANNYSGNLTELCPVGAITDRDFRFKTRTWFLRSGESVCPLCSRLCSTFIDYHPGFSRFEEKRKVYRIRARENHEINGYWICDYGRYNYSYLDSERWTRVVMNKNGQKPLLSWEKALAMLAEKVRTLKFLRKERRMAVILNSALTNEELFLTQKIFKKDLCLENVYIIDPKSGQGDGFLLTAERTANRRGAREVGFDFREFHLNFLEKIDLLLIFGNALLDWFKLDELKGVLSKVKAKFLFTPAASPLGELTDFVLPTAYIAEKEGSLINADGKIQRFAPALSPEGEALPEWKILVNLARELKFNFRYYLSFNSVASIYTQMAREIPFFQGEP